MLSKLVGPLSARVLWRGDLIESGTLIESNGYSLVFTSLSNLCFALSA